MVITRPEIPTPGIWAYEDYNSGLPAAQPARLRRLLEYDGYEYMRTNQFAKFQSYGTANETTNCDLFLLSWTLTGDGTTAISDLGGPGQPLPGQRIRVAHPQQPRPHANLLYVDFVGERAR